MNEHLLDNVVLNFDSRSQWVLNMALALVMFGIALEISVNDFKRLFKSPKAIYTGILCQFFFLPALTFVLVLIIEPIPSIAMGMFMVAACPGGNVSNFITHLAGGNAALSISLTAVATLVAVFMTPLNLQFWGELYGAHLDYFKGGGRIALGNGETGLVAIGASPYTGGRVNHFHALLAKKVGRVLKRVSLVFFILLIVVALYNNRAIFANYIFYVFWLVLLHNVLAFFTGFSVAKMVGLSPRDVRAITIETGIQNSGLGLLLIFSFFDGLGGMALLAAFWGVWHLVSGLLLASFWGYRPVKIERLT